MPGERRPPTKKGPASKIAKARRKRFAAEAIKAMANPDGTLADAAVAAGLSPNGAAQAGSRMLSHPEVQAEIERRLAKAMGQDEIIERLTKIAAARRPATIIVEDTFMSAGLELHPVQKKRRVYSPESALGTLAKIRGLLKDAPPPPPSQNIQLNVVLANMPEHAVEALTEAMAKAAAIEAEAKPA